MYKALYVDSNFNVIPCEEPIAPHTTTGSQIKISSTPTDLTDHFYDCYKSERISLKNGSVIHCIPSGSYKGQLKEFPTSGSYKGQLKETLFPTACSMCEQMFVTKDITAHLCPTCHSRLNKIKLA